MELPKNTPNLLFWIVIKNRVTNMGPLQVVYYNHNNHYVDLNSVKNLLHIKITSQRFENFYLEFSLPTMYDPFFLKFSRRSPLMSRSLP